MAYARLLEGQPGRTSASGKVHSASPGGGVVGVTAAASAMQQQQQLPQAADPGSPANGAPGRPPAYIDRAASMPEFAAKAPRRGGSAALDLRRRFGTPLAAPSPNVRPAAAARPDSSGATPPQLPGLPTITLPAPAVAESPFAAAAAVAVGHRASMDDLEPTLRSQSLPPIRLALSSTASAEALARYSTLQRASVQSALEAISHYTSLRTTAGPAFVDARNLIKVGELGSGAYATVEHCQLANWRDPSQHGARGQGGALAALERSSSPGTALERRASLERFSSPHAPDASSPDADAFRDDSAYPRHAGGGRGASRKSPFGSRLGFGGSGGGGCASQRGRRGGCGRRPALLDVAVKHLRPSLFDCQADLDDFVREAVLLAGLQHRSVVGVLGVGFSEAPPGGGSAVGADSIFMVTELCWGGSLREKVLQQMVAGRKVVYTYAQGLAWCAQAADGLAFLHAQSPRIIHRDIKLDNVLLTDDGEGGLEAKLADFGLHATVEALDNSSLSKRLAELVQAEQQAEPASPARGARSLKFSRSLSDKDRRTSGDLRRGSSDEKPLRHSSKSADATAGGGLLSKVRSLVRSRGSSGAGVRPAPPPQDSPGHNLTGQTGSFLGMAPEVTLAKPYDEKADVFSLGCVITDVLGKQLTSSEVAYHGTIQEFQRYAMRVAYGYRRRTPANWAPQLTALVEACLAQRPADRPPASEVAARLRGMADAVADMDKGLRRGACGCLG